MKTTQAQLHYRIGYNTPNNAFRSNLVKPNRDGTLFERLEDLVDMGERAIAVSVDEVTADIIDIDGGPILITTMVGLVTAQIGSTTTTCKIVVDRDDGATDNELSTAVAITGDVVGTVYVFSNANPSTLTPLTSGSAGGGTTLMSPWFVPEGMLEQTMSANPGGADGDHITWYIRYVPLTTGITVTAQ